jgi:hypothetical protein
MGTGASLTLAFRDMQKQQLHRTPKSTHCRRHMPHPSDGARNGQRPQLISIHLAL